MVNRNTIVGVDVRDIARSVRATAVLPAEADRVTGTTVTGTTKKGAADEKPNQVVIWAVSLGFEFR